MCVGGVGYVYLLRVCRSVCRVCVTLGQWWDGMATKRRCSRSSDEAPLHHLRQEGEGRGTCEISEEKWTL